MTRSYTTRHNLPVALLLATMLLLAPAVSARAGTAFEPRAGTALQVRARGIPTRICPIAWQRGPRYVRRLVLCAARRFQVPGGPAKALAIAALTRDDPHWTATLKDGTRVLIRPIHKEDAALERTFLKRLSPESRRLRFLGQMGEPSDERYVAAFSQIRT